MQVLQQVRAEPNQEAVEVRPEERAQEVPRVTGAEPGEQVPEEVIQAAEQAQVREQEQPAAGVEPALLHALAAVIN